MGRTRYIWLVGVLGWGVATGSMWAVAMAAMQGWDRLPVLLAIALVGFPIGGYFFGAWVWKASSRSTSKRRPRSLESDEKGNGKDDGREGTFFFSVTERA